MIEGEFLGDENCPVYKPSEYSEIVLKVNDDITGQAKDKFFEYLQYGPDGIGARNYTAKHKLINRQESCEDKSCT